MKDKPQKTKNKKQKTKNKKQKTKNKKKQKKQKKRKVFKLERGHLYDRTPSFQTLEYFEISLLLFLKFEKKLQYGTPSAQNGQKKTSTQQRGIMSFKICSRIRLTLSLLEGILVHLGPCLDLAAQQQQRRQRVGCKWLLSCKEYRSMHFARSNHQVHINNQSSGDFFLLFCCNSVILWIQDSGGRRFLFTASNTSSTFFLADNSFLFLFLFPNSF